MESKFTNRQRNALVSLAKLHLWEQSQLRPFETMSGQFLYFKLVQQTLSGTDAQQSLKDIHFDTQLSERAIRLKVREFEEMGLIQSVPNQSDKRARQLIPTSQMLALIEQHANAFEQVFAENLLVIEKNNNQ